MISRSSLQTIWRASEDNPMLVEGAIHYSFSVTDEHSLFVVKHKSEDQADYLIVIDLLTNRTREFKFAPIRTSRNASRAQVWTFEECGPSFGIVNFRTDQQSFGVAICIINYHTKTVHSEEIQLLGHHPDTLDTIYTTRKAPNGKIYLLEDPLFPMQMYKLENGYVDGDNNIRLHYDVRQRRGQIEGHPEEYLCINDGIDKTCCELSVFLAHRQTGVVQNYITKLTKNAFPLKCNGRLVGNMQSIPFQNGVLALFQYEPKETNQGELNAFAYLDLTTLQWQDLNIQLESRFVQFQVTGLNENILMIMETENDSNANPVLKTVHRLKIGALESLQQLCYYTLIKHMPKIRTMTEEERRHHGIICFL